MPYGFGIYSQHPEHSYYIADIADIDSPMCVNTTPIADNKNLILIGGNRQCVIFSNGLNIPIRYINNEGLTSFVKKKGRDYLLVKLFNPNNQVKLYDIFDNQ